MKFSSNGFETIRQHTHDAIMRNFGDLRAIGAELGLSKQDTWKRIKNYGLVEELIQSRESQPIAEHETWWLGEEGLE